MTIFMTDVKKPLAAMSKIIKRKSSIAVLDTVLVKCEDSTLTFTATDLETFIQFSVPYDSPDFAACLNFKQLSKLLKKEKQNFSIGCEGEDVYLELSDGSKYTFRDVADDDNYPMMPGVSATLVSGSVPIPQFVDALTTTKSSVNKDLVKSRALTGYILDTCDSKCLTVVTCNRHTLYTAELDALITGEKGAHIMKSEAVPPLLEMLKKENGNLEFEIGEKFITFHHKNWVIHSRLMDASIIDWKSFFYDTDSKDMVHVNTSRFMDCIEAVMPVSGDFAKKVRVEIGNSIRVKLDNTVDNISAEKELDSGVSNLKTHDLTYNVEYIQKFLKGVKAKSLQIFYDPTTEKATEFHYDNNRVHYVFLINPLITD